MPDSMKKRGTLLVAGLLLCFPAVSLGQQTQKDPRVNPPIAPAEESTSRAPDGVIPAGITAAAPASNPDARPLTGAELLSLGSTDRSHNYLLPIFSFMSGGQWSDGGYRYHGNARGGIAFHRDSGTNQLSLTYMTGAFLGGPRFGIRQQAHSLAFNQSFQAGRWTFMVADAFMLMPESSFGYGAFHGFEQPSLGALPGWRPGFGGGNQPVINPALIPDQNVNTGSSTRYSNTVIGQATMQLTPRWSMTTSGSFGFLRFLDDGFVESNQGSVRVGANYVWTPRDTLGFSYNTMLLRFDDDRALTNHTVQMMYGRRLTGTLALQVGAGPSFLLADNPGIGSQRRASWSASSYLIYSGPIITYSLGYNYRISNGSGVQAGAQAHVLHFASGRQLNRTWSLQGVGGYAYNEGISILNQTSFSRTFDNWFAGVDLGRSLGRYSRLSFRYHVSRQSASCLATALVCPQAGLRHNFGINVDLARQFNPRPIYLD
jgi:hypothetical protein